MNACPICWIEQTHTRCHLSELIPSLLHPFRINSMLFHHHFHLQYFSHYQHAVHSIEICSDNIFRYPLPLEAETIHTILFNTRRSRGWKEVTNKAQQTIDEPMNKMRYHLQESTIREYSGTDNIFATDGS